MVPKPCIAIVGPGRLGTALAMELRRAEYSISEIVSLEDIALGIDKLERQEGNPIRILVRP